MSFRRANMTHPSPSVLVIPYQVIDLGPCLQPEVISRDLDVLAINDQAMGPQILHNGHFVRSILHLVDIDLQHLALDVIP